MHTAIRPEPAINGRPSEHREPRQPRPTRAVVIGASIAGLLVARVLSDHVDEVEVLERERLRPEPEPRGHVPQGRHAHGLLGAGEDRISAWFPGLVEELEAYGAQRVDGAQAWWWHAGAYRARGDWGRGVLGVTRPLLETVLRTRTAGLPRVTVTDDAMVERLLFDGRRVTGVVVDGHEHQADLVIDCSGRNSRIAHALAADGLLDPPMSHITIDAAYGTRLLRRRPGDIEGGTFAMSAHTPPEVTRAGIAVPIEGDRWIMSLAGMHGDVPPTDDAGYLAFARSLPSPILADLLEHAEPLTPVMSFRLPSNQWRHYEKVPRLLPGFVVLGDAVCSFNPIYGQGMSSAALQAEALGEALSRHGLGSERLSRDVQRRAARIVATPWAMAAGADFTHPRTTGPKPRGTDVLNRYLATVLQASHTALPVQRRLNLVQNLIEPPSSLLRPGMVARVLWAARRSPSVTGMPVGHPAVPARQVHAAGPGTPPAVRETEATPARVG